MDRGALWVTFHGIAKSQTGLSDYTFLFLPSHPQSYSFNLISLSHLFLWSNFWKETYTAILSSSSHPMHSATHYIWLSSLSLKLHSEEDRRGPVASLSFKQLDTTWPSSGIFLTASGIWHCHALSSPNTIFSYLLWLHIPTSFHLSDQPFPVSMLMPLTLPVLEYWSCSQDSCLWPSELQILHFISCDLIPLMTVSSLSSGAILFSAVQFLSQVRLCNPIDCSKLGLPVHHQLLELTHSHVHRVGDAIQPSHPLLSPSPPVFNLSQHQGLFQWVSSLHQVAKILEFQLQHQSFQWIFSVDFL